MVALLALRGLPACQEASIPKDVRVALTSPVGVADVSFLYPIPEKLGQRTSLIGASQEGAHEGVDGAFAVGFRALLLSRVGAQNLVRATFMGSEQVGLTWRFGGFDIDGDIPTPIEIPLVSQLEQIFRNNDETGLTFEDAAAYPASPSEDDFTLFFSASGADAATDAQRRSAYAAAVRIENPLFHSPDTIDCATCHAVRRHAERAYGLSGEGLEELFLHPTGLPLEGATIEQTNELRAFGYLGNKPSVSQRTVNETAQVVAHVNGVVLEP